MTKRQVITRGKHVLGKLSRNCDKNGTRNCQSVLTWELQDTDKGPEFSAQGEVWNHIKTDIVQGGQCVDTLADLFPHDKKAQRIKAVWEEYHLNGMKPGCEHQRAEGWDKRPIDKDRPTDRYISLTKEGEHYPYYQGWNMLTWASPDKVSGGLLGVPCPVCGYKYGTPWLYEAIPQDIIDEIKTW